MLNILWISSTVYITGAVLSNEQFLHAELRNTFGAALALLKGKSFLSFRFGLVLLTNFGRDGGDITLQILHGLLESLELL